MAKKIVLKIDQIESNATGNRLVIDDFVSVLGSHNHSDLYYTEPEIDTKLLDLKNSKPANLEDLTDFTLASVTGDQVLSYDATNSTWVNSAPPAGDIGGSDDVDFSTLADGQTVQWDAAAGKWKAVDIPSGGGTLPRWVLQSGSTVIDGHNTQVANGFILNGNVSHSQKASEFSLSDGSTNFFDSALTSTANVQRSWATANNSMILFGEKDNLTRSTFHYGHSLNPSSKAKNARYLTFTNLGYSEYWECTSANDGDEVLMTHSGVPNAKLERFTFASNTSITDWGTQNTRLHSQGASNGSVAYFPKGKSNTVSQGIYKTSFRSGSSTVPIIDAWNFLENPENGYTDLTCDGVSVFGAVYHNLASGDARNDGSGLNGPYASMIKVSCASDAMERVASLTGNPSSLPLSGPSPTVTGDGSNMYSTGTFYFTATIDKTSMTSYAQTASFSSCAGGHMSSSGVCSNG